MYKSKSIFTAILLSTTILNLTGCGGGNNDQEKSDQTLNGIYHISKSESYLTPQKKSLTLKLIKENETSSSLSLKSNEINNEKFFIESRYQNFVSVNGQTITLEKRPTDIKSIIIYASINNRKVAQTSIVITPSSESTVEINPSNYKLSDSDAKVKLVAYGKTAHFSDQSYLLSEDTNLQALKNWAVYNKPNEDLRQLMVYNLTTKNIEETQIALVGGETGGFRDHYYNVNKPNYKPTQLVDNYYNCMLVQYRDHQIGLKASDLIKLHDLLKSNDNYKLQKGMHITVTPFHDPKPNTQCKQFSNGNNLTADYYDIYSININEPIPKINNNNLNCIISGNDATQCPQYENTHFETFSDNNGQLKLRLVGPLYHWFTQVRNKDLDKPIHIQIQNPVDKKQTLSNAILNADVFTVYIPNGLTKQCKTFLEHTQEWGEGTNKINSTQENLKYLMAFKQACSSQEVSYGGQDISHIRDINFYHKQGVPSYTTGHQIILDGNGILQNNGFSLTAAEFGQLCTIPGDCWNNGLAEVGLVAISDQVVLSSQYKRSLDYNKEHASIIVNGLTIDGGGGTKKQTSNVRLNYHSLYTYDESDFLNASGADKDENDFPVYFHNVSQVGNWNEQSDSASIEARHSFIENNFFLSGDDNLKTMADHVTFDNNTIIGGASGNPIMLGQYGYNRGQQYVSITDTYIVRMNQWNDNEGDWDKQQGIIATHTIFDNDAGNARLYTINSKSAQFDGTHTYDDDNFNHINISNVYKLTTPEDYSYCLKSLNLRYTGKLIYAGGEHSPEFMYNNLINVPSQGNCWYQSDISFKKMQYNIEYANN